MSHIYAGITRFASAFVFPTFRLMIRRARYLFGTSSVPCLEMQPQFIRLCSAIRAETFHCNVVTLASGQGLSDSARFLVNSPGGIGLSGSARFLVHYAEGISLPGSAQCLETCPVFCHLTGALQSVFHNLIFGASLLCSCHAQLLLHHSLRSAARLYYVGVHFGITTRISCLALTLPLLLLPPNRSHHYWELQCKGRRCSSSKGTGNQWHPTTLWHVTFSLQYLAPFRSLALRL